MWVCLKVVDLHKRLEYGLEKYQVLSTSQALVVVGICRCATHICVCKLAVLHVQLAVEGPDAGVSVVVGVLTNTIWETLLEVARVSMSAELMESSRWFCGCFVKFCYGWYLRHTPTSVVTVVLKSTVHTLAVLLE